MGESIIEHYRDPHLLVVEKPSGLASQPTANNSANLYDLLNKKDSYVGLHHRLDTPASGLMLFTLNRKANPGIAKAFREQKIERCYLSVLVGELDTTGGAWSDPIDGKKATTHWKRLVIREGMTVIEARLESGRTHQIRKHAVAAGHPIVGDQRYGGSAGRLWKRLALHAHKLAFVHPILHQRIQIEIPMPADLAALMARMEIQT